jgi:hypothetical protein
MSPKQTQFFLFVLTGQMIPEEQIPLVEYLVVTQLQGPIIASSVGVLGAPRLAEAQMLIAGVEAGIQPCSPAFQRGRQFGRAVSNIQSVAEIVAGVLTMLGAFTLGPPLDFAAVLAGGGAASWATGGVAVAVNVGVLEAGGALVTHGAGVLAHNRGNPVPNVSHATGGRRPAPPPSPGARTEKMHWIPREVHERVQRLYPKVTRRQLNFTEPLELDFHKYVHGKGGTVVDSYNDAVIQWLDRYGTSKSLDQFLEFVDDLRARYLVLYDQYLTGG